MSLREQRKRQDDSAQGDRQRSDADDATYSEAPATIPASMSSWARLSDLRWSAFNRSISASCSISSRALSAESSQDGERQGSTAK